MERYATVAFPVIGDPLPAFPCAPDAFLNWLVKKTPHWLYHLRIKESRTGSFHSRLPQVSAEAVQNLTEALGLRGVFDVRPLEFAHGDIPKPSSSEYAFAFPRNFRHHSGFLALAVGLVAAAYKRPLPPWVLLSGCLATPFTTPLALARTSKIEEKVLLSFGLHGGYVLQPLLDLLYAHRTTEDHLGPRHERTLPGEVRLLLVPTDIDLHPHEFLAPLAVQSLSAPLQEFGQEDWDGLLGRVRELAGDDLLLVQVPTAAHALCLLGYHHVHPLLVTRLDEQPIRVFRVRHQREGLPPDALHANPESEALQELAELEYRLARARARDVYTKLKVILDQARKRLRCQSGDVSVCGFEPAWLRVLARHCPGVDDPPHFVTAAPAPTVDVLGHNETRVVEDTATDAEYQAALSPDNPLRAREGAERFARYQGFLRSIRAYVKVPLCRGGKAVGALYVHRDEPGPFHPAMVRLVEALASRATQEVVIFLEEEQRALSRTAPLAGVGSVEDLARRVASLSRTGAQAELGRELARLACAKANAYRAAVRLLCPDVRELIRIGYCGPGLEEEQAPVLAREDDSAAAHAVVTGRSYLIPDASDPGVRLTRIPPLPGSHAAILLRMGGHILGVLSVDWAEPGACGPDRQALLEELAGRYALAIKAHSTDDLFGQLDRFLSGAARSGAEPDYERFVRLVVRMVGGQEGALLVRRAETGRYHLLASLQHPGWAEDHACAPGEGVTGWVLQHNRPVRVADLRDAAELAGLGIASAALEEGWYGAETPPGRWAYLGVPLAVADEVVGALLITGAGEAGGFGSYDQQIALSAAARLAGWLYQHQGEARRARALESLRVPPSSPDPPGRVAERVLRALQDGIGPAGTQIYLADDHEHGGDQRVLHRLLASDPGSEGVPVRLRPGEGIAGSVWADGEAFVYHDAATDRRLSQVGAVDLPQTAGSGVCVPLGAGKESLGTLHVHRPTPWGLSPRERAFVADVGRWAAQALRTADDEDHERRSRLVERAFELIQRYLAATGGEVNSAPEEEAELLAEIGEALVAGLGGGPAWLLVADPTRSQFRCRRAWGVAVEVVPEPAPAAVETRLGGARFRICDPTTKTVLSPLLDGFKGDSEVRRLLDTSPWVVLRFAPGGELLALFFLAVPPPHCVNRARTERWARTLDLLSAVFVLGRRLVHAHQELPNDATE